MPDEFYKLLLLDAPVPTISKTNEVTVGSADIASGVLVAMVPTISTPTTLISSGFVEQEYTYTVFEPTISYTTNVSGVLPVSGIYSYSAPVPTISGISAIKVGSADNPELALAHPMPVIVCTPIVETLFNFTRVLSSKSGVYTNETIAASNDTIDDVDLLPVGSAIGDGILMGIHHPNWYGATVKVSTIGTGTYTLIWEYWNGSVWDALVIIDEYEVATTGHFKTLGNYRVRFESPAYWDPLSISGSDELYWIRCRQVSGSATILPRATRIWGRSVPVRKLNTRQTMNELVGEYHMTHLPLLTGILFRLGTSFYWKFKMVNYTDYASHRALTVPRVSVSFDGRDFESVSNVISEIGHGWYTVQIPATYVRPQAILRATAPGCAQCDMTIDVFPLSTIIDYNTWGDIASLTWGDLALMTWLDAAIEEL